MTCDFCRSRSMKTMYILLITCALTLAMASIPSAFADDMYEDYPAGSDVMDKTQARMGLRIGSDDYLVKATGPTEVERGDPYDPGDGRWTIDTEIVSMTLTGTHAMLGPVSIIESPTETSSGTIRQQVGGQDFPADSFFDVFIEIETTFPYPNNRLHNDIPHPMNTEIYRIPPYGSIYVKPGPDIPLKNEEGDTVGAITSAIHIVNYPVGGVAIPVDKLVLLAPYITFAIAAVAVALGAVSTRKRWFGKAVVPKP